MKKKKNHLISKNPFGFTLIELLVSVFILALLGALALANFYRGNQSYQLLQTAQKLVADLNRAQNMSLTGSFSRDYGIVNGFGVNFKQGNDYYILFADRNDNKTFDEGVDFVVETIKLPDNFGASWQVKEITYRSSASQYPPVFSPVGRSIYYLSGLDIFFKPPYAVCYVNSQTETERFSPPYIWKDVFQGIITLKPKGNSALTKTVTVETSGKIMVN